MGYGEAFVGTLYGIVYEIRCTVSGKSYIGITKRTLARRWSAHVLRANNKDSGCTALANAILKYGKDQFVVECIASASSAENLLAAEREIIRQNQTMSPKGYNLSAGGSGLLDPTDETRARMRASHLGKKQSQELIRKRMEPRIGKPRSREAVEKSRLAQLGTKRKSWGRHTIESRALMSEKARVRVCSPATRAKMSARMMGSRLWEKRKKGGRLRPTALQFEMPI